MSVQMFLRFVALLEEPQSGICEGEDGALLRKTPNPAPQRQRQYSRSSFGHPSA